MKISEDQMQIANFPLAEKLELHMN